MPSLIPKKYKDDMPLMAPSIDNVCKQKNIIFIVAALNGDIEILKTLFSMTTAGVFLALGNRLKDTFGVNETIKNEHMQNFPDHYEMDETIRAWIIAAICTPIHPRIKYWSEEKKWEVIKILVENNANALPILLDKETSLERLKQVIRWGADVNANHQGYTALHVAVVSPNTSKEKIDFLILENANVNSISKIKDYEIGTPAHMLLANEKQALFEHHITRAADKIDPNIKDGEGKTLLLLAAKMRSIIAVSVLLNAFKGRIDVNTSDKQGRTPLHFASLYGFKEMAEKLIAADAKIDAKDLAGSTSLHYACIRPSIRHIMFRSIEIEDQRDISAPCNALQDKQKRPVLVNGNEILITKDSLGNYLTGLQGIIRDNSTSTFMESFFYLRELYDTLTGKSLSKVCEEGIESLIEYLLASGADPRIANLQSEKPSEIAPDSSVTNAWRKKL